MTDDHVAVARAASAHPEVSRVVVDTPDTRPDGSGSGDDRSAVVSREGEICEGVCQLCRVEHGNWFAPSDIWNAVCRDGDRGNPDRWNYLCPVCFMRLADEQELAPVGWLFTPSPGCIVRYSSWVKIQQPTSATDEPGSSPDLSSGVSRG